MRCFRSPATFNKRSHGTKHVLKMMDHFIRYVVLALIQDKNGKVVAHALVTNLFCPYSTLRVSLRDNGTEFGNNNLEENVNNSI